MLHSTPPDLEDKSKLTKDIHVTMDLFESTPNLESSNLTTVPVRYTIDDSAIEEEESSGDIEYLLHEIYSTDDENGNNTLKSANSESTSQVSESSESDFSQHTHNYRTSNGDMYENPDSHEKDNEYPLVNGLISPRYSVPSTGTSGFRLSIPAIKEGRESGSDVGGHDSSAPSTPPSVKANSEHLIVKNMSARRSSFSGPSRIDQRPRRRFSISISSSDDSSSDSEAEEQAKIKQYMQSRSHRRRHSMATTSDELVQAMSVLMGRRRGSGKDNSLFPLLAHALTNLANSSNSIDSGPRRKRHSTTRTPLIQVSEDTECSCGKSGRSISPNDLLSRPHSPVSGSLKLNNNNESKTGLSEHDSQRLNTEIEVLRILTTRSPAVSEDEDSDSENHEKPPRRRKSSRSRRSSTCFNLLEKPSQSRRSSISAVPTTPKPSKSRRSSITPPSSGSHSRKISGSLLQVPHDHEGISAHDLYQRLENANLQPDQRTTQPKTSPSDESTLLVPGRRNRRASMCIPGANHPAAYPPASKAEEEEIRFRANQRGRRRSSWAGAGAPPPLVGQVRAISPMTLLRESNYYGDDLADNKKYQDPYYLTIHFITDPKKSRKLKKLLKPLIDSIVPKLKLFNYVERSEKMPKKPEMSKEEKVTTVPASGVVLFINEGFGMERILEAQKYLSEKADWTVHHSEKVGSNAVPYPTNNQDFYAHCEEMPLWAVRQVHFGRDRLRFQIFVSNDNWQDTIDFYSTVLARNFQYQKDDFCYFLVFASRELNLEVQLAFKKLPVGFMPRLLDSTILQFKVENIEGLVPLLPHVCSPISDRRWQTMDPDGNKILLFKTLNGDLAPGVFLTPSTGSTTSTISSDKSTEMSDTETGTPPGPSPRPDSPKLPEFVDSVQGLDDEEEALVSAV